MFYKKELLLIYVFSLLLLFFSTPSYCAVNENIIEQNKNEVLENHENKHYTGLYEMKLKDPVSLSTTFTNRNITSNESINVHFSKISSDTTHVILSESENFQGTNWIQITPVDQKAIIPYMLTAGEGVKTVYSKIKNSAFEVETNSQTITLDTTAPKKIEIFNAEPGISKVFLSWESPEDNDFIGIMIRHSTDSFPLTTEAGKLLNTFTGDPGESFSVEHENLSNGVSCYYSIFSYDEAGNYSKPVFRDSMPISHSGGFVITASEQIMAGQDFGITIQVIKEDETLDDSYFGTIDLSIEYILPNSGTLNFRHGDITFSNGIATVTMNYPDAGTFRIKGSGIPDSSLTGKSNLIIAGPSSLRVDVEKKLLFAGEEFPLTITPLNAFGAETPNYTNDGISMNYTLITPSGGKGKIPYNQVDLQGTTVIENLSFNEAGKLFFTVTDSSYITGASITGTSPEITFIPAKLEITHLNPYPLRPFYYLEEPFEILVKTLSVKGKVTENYRGSINFSGGLEVGSSKTYTFTSSDKGEHTFKDLKGLNEGSLSLKSTDLNHNQLTGELTNIEVKYGQIRVVDAEGPVGKLQTKVVIEDRNGCILKKDSSTDFAVELIDPNSNNSVQSPSSTQPLSVNLGEATIKVSNKEAETVLATPTTSLPLESKTGKITFIAPKEITPFPKEGGIRILFWKETKND